jgi:hypothetical protein
MLDAKVSYSIGIVDEYSQVQILWLEFRMECIRERHWTVDASRQDDPIAQRGSLIEASIQQSLSTENRLVKKTHIPQRTLPSADFSEASAHRVDGQILLGVIRYIDSHLVLLAIVDL